MRNAWETYWRAGYTVAGSSQVVVEEHCRTIDAARTAAQNGAAADIEALKQVGVDATVTLWVQKWRTRCVEESEDREAIDIVEIERRREPVELGWSNGRPRKDAAVKS